MKERDLDEFGSLFRRSVIPTIEVERIEISDIVVLADFSPWAAACGRVAAHLKERFGARVSIRFLLHPSDRGHEAEARRLMDGIAGDERHLVAGDVVAHVKEVAEERPSLIVAPAPLHRREPSPEADALGDVIDALLVATPLPTLLMRGPARDASIFERILVKIPGGKHELIEQFSFAFALCPSGGRIRLLHVVDRADLARLAELLEVTPEIDTREGTEDLLAAVEGRMSHLLRGAVRTAEGQAFRVESDVAVGDPFAIVPERARDASLLIVGSQASHTEFLDSRAYALIRRVPDLPVLAL